MTSFMEIEVCPTLPNVESLKMERLNKIKQDVLHSLGLIHSMNPFPKIQQTLSPLFPGEQTKICSDILFHLLHTASQPTSSADGEGNTSEAAAAIVNSGKPIQFFTQEKKIQFLMLLRLCPAVSSVKDDQDHLLLHHLCLMESPDRECIKYLIIANPASLLSSVDNRDFGKVNPFQMILLKADADFELGFYMVLSNPKVAK
jgi:hypothetical protein